MNEVIKAGEVFKLAELVPYADGKIVNMDVVHNDTMKFVVMAFDEGTGLSEHVAPGEAIIFALDGERVIGYEGKDYPIKAGENFKFAKAGLHSVKATKKFKMALLLMLLAGGCEDTSGKPQIDKTNHLKEAYEFGKNIYISNSQIKEVYHFRATRCARKPFCFSIVSTVKPAFSAIEMNSADLYTFTSPCPNRLLRGSSRWFMSQTTRSEEV